MTKKIFIILLLFLIQQHCALSQNVHCKFDSLYETNLSYQYYRQEFESKQQMHSLKGIHSSGGVKTIPVVVHIIHHGGIENISDTQVFSQMEVLNKDFRRLNADTGNTSLVFKNIAADMELQFCLAGIDPSGNPTTGIDRVFTADTTLNSIQMIDLYGWDNNKYMNIYVSAKVGAFSSFPGDPDSTDGIFITHGRFGTTGTAGSELYSEFSRFGRTGTHEAGHYFGLFHTFSVCDTSCNGGDYVCDTPPTDMRWFVSNCLPQSMNTCFETPDLPDQVDNYMDYNIDSCANMFSEGQKTRVVNTLNLYRSVLWSNTNLIATGCSGFTGVDKNIISANITVYPNPASGKINIKGLTGTSEISIRDFTGKIILSFTTEHDEAILNTEFLTEGIYLVTIRNTGYVVTKKVVFERSQESVK